MAMPLEQWIDDYARAWETADCDLIVNLFTPDASYRSYVFNQPHVGSEAIRNYWTRGAGTQRNVKVRMGKPVIEPNGRVVVEWWTTMIDPEKGEITLPGCLLLRFEDNGRCFDLWEYWHVKDGLHEPPAGWGM